MSQEVSDLKTLEISELKASLLRCREGIASHQAELYKLHEALAEAYRAGAADRIALVSLKEKISIIENNNITLREENNILRNENAELLLNLNYLNAILASKSWRYIRILRNIFRK